MRRSFLFADFPAALYGSGQCVPHGFCSRYTLSMLGGANGSFGISVSTDPQFGEPVRAGNSPTPSGEKTR